MILVCRLQAWFPVLYCPDTVVMIDFDRYKNADQPAALDLLEPLFD